MTAEQTQSLNRLIHVAKGPTHQSRRVADFLLAWWNAGECGGFSYDLTILWSLDKQITDDMVVIFQMIITVHQYPDTLGYNTDFQQIIEQWRPELVRKRPQAAAASAD